MNKLKIIMPLPSRNMSNYIPTVKTESFVYMSGVIPVKNEKIMQRKFEKEF